MLLILLHFDLDQKPRLNGTIDMGAYEFGSNINCSLYAGLTTIYVDSSAVGSNNNGLSWGSAFNLLQDALFAALCSGVDTIKVAQGTYYPSVDTVYDKCTGQIITINNLDRSASFSIPPNVVMIGGFQVVGVISSVPFCNKTILCGDIQKNNILTDNSIHVVTIDRVGNTVTVDGFCITKGCVDIINDGTGKFGAGWF